MGDPHDKTFRNPSVLKPLTNADALMSNSQFCRHLQPPSAWIRVILSLLAVPSRHPSHRGGGGIGTVPYALIILRSSGDHF
ncbi:hypothetical protein CDAR_167571 [Caerostris darwini]|uniref:Uncharacterized protein n=1 Tax=Caerostris darwini TaxID=1538125 RepID=A0AAV4M9S3_9ARAC|nr:hypothetical protein CDAR_167571 [Caerostris darwini]